MKKIKKKARIKTSIIVIFGILCLLVALYSFYKIIIWKQNVDRNNKIKEEIDDLVKVDEKTNLKDKYTVDFKSLQDINPDVIAWIKVNGTNIEYPVVKGKDNNYYLKHNIKKERNNVGWIFADYKNKFDGTDRNIVIFGHNTKDGSMFGNLKNVLEYDWQKDVKNTIIVMVNKNDSTIYQVFSTYSIKQEDYYITTDFKNGDEFSKFIDTIKKRSNHDYHVDVDSSDSILTLSSCTNKCSKRVVLHAKKIY